MLLQLLNSALHVFFSYDPKDFRPAE